MELPVCPVKPLVFFIIIRSNTPLGWSITIYWLSVSSQLPASCREQRSGRACTALSIPYYGGTEYSLLLWGYWIQPCANSKFTAVSIEMAATQRLRDWNNPLFNYIYNCSQGLPLLLHLGIQVSQVEKRMWNPVLGKQSPYILAINRKLNFDYKLHSLNNHIIAII